MASAVTSIYNNVISAASAGFAPTNSADVSAIASSYAESAASSKQDTLTFSYDYDKISAINGSALAGQGGGGLVTAIGTSESGITSLNNSGLVDTAALHSADYSSLYVQEPLYISASGDSSYIGISGGAGDYLTAKVGSGQATFTTALQDGMDKRPALVISAQRNAGSSMYPRLLVTDWNNTTGETHSGALLANAFEFYSCPDSARGEVDPSGLVQSRLDASRLRFNVDPAISSYTKSSEYTRSGMRLGLSGNSASWVAISGNGTSGGFITLDDGSGVSGRIVASSIPYWNDKLDGSASSSFYTTANESGYVDSAYVESQVSSKQDTLTFDWDADSAISSINGSALAGQGGGAPIVVTGTAWDPDTSAWVYNLTSNLSAAERHVWTYQNGYKWDYIEYLKDDSGNRFPMMAYFLAAGAEQMYNGGVNGNGRLQFSPSNSMFTADGSNKYGLSPLTWATGASMNLSAGYFRASYRGDTIFISRGPSGTLDSSNSAQIKAVRIEAHNNRGSNISAYDATTTGYYGTTAMKLGRSGVFVDDSGNSSNTAASATLTTGSLTFYSAGSSDVMRQSSIPYWNGKADSSALSSYALSADVSGTVDLVSTQSANWGGSALALSAGPGVKLEKVGDTLVASTDETLLFSGSNGGMVATNLTEPLSSFNSFKICFNPFGNGMSREWKEFSWAGSSDVYTIATFHNNGNDNLAWFAAFQPNTDGTTITPIANKLWILGSTTVQDRTQMSVYRVVGINRTAEA